MWFWQEKALWATQNCLSCELQANQLLRPRGSESDAASHAARMSPCQLVWLKLATAPAQALVPDEVCELLHPKPPHNWSYKNPSRFELAGSSNGGFHCNQRGFQPFFWLKWLAKIQGLALFFFLPPLFFPCLAGGKRNAWLESELVVMWAVSSMGSYEVPLPPAHQESKSRKGSSSSESQVPFPNQPLAPKTSLRSFSVPVLILASSPGSRRCSQAAGMLQALFLLPRPPDAYHLLHDRMEFTVLPKEVTSDQPFVRVEKTLVHREEIYTLTADVNKKNQPCSTACGLQAFKTSRTWCISPPGARVEQLVAPCVSGKDGGLVFKGWLWHIILWSSHSTEP